MREMEASSWILLRGETTRLYGRGRQVKQDWRDRLAAGGKPQVGQRGRNLFLQNGFGQWGDLVLVGV